jgi:hypothetical protein
VWRFSLYPLLVEATLCAWKDGPPEAELEPCFAPVLDRLEHGHAFLLAVANGWAARAHGFVQVRAQKWPAAGRMQGTLGLR